MAALCVTIAPASWAHAEDAYRELHDADPRGSIEIVDFSGSVEVSGWERPQVEISAAPGDQHRVHTSTSGSQTSIQVPPGELRGGHLVIHIPAQSSLSASLVTADLKVTGVHGDVNLRTVSGNLSGEVGGNLRANTATGSVKMSIGGSKSIEVRTISGDVQLSGGSGDVEVTTVSGDAKIELATVTRGRFKSISGNMSTKLTLAPDAELEGESVSGNLRFDFPAAPAADFDIQSFSGTIDNCFGPKAVKVTYGPGSRLEFKSGADAQARVRVETKSGDVTVCTKEIGTAAR